MLGDEKHQTVALSRADTITLARGFLVACSGGFINIPRPQGWLGWTPGLVYLLAFIGDGLDGYVARKVEETHDLRQNSGSRVRCPGDLAGHDPGS